MTHRMTAHRTAPLATRPAGLACALLLFVGCGSATNGDSGEGDGSTVRGGDGDAATAPDTGAGADDAAPQSQVGDATAVSDSSGRAVDASSAADATAPADARAPVDAGRAVDSGGVAEAGAVSADGGSDPCGPANPAVVPLPVIGAATFDVRTSGAVGDGNTDNTTALQAALDAATAAGGGVVSVPAGTFLSGPIVVGSGTRLDLAAGAVLEMLPMGSWPGTTPFITANNGHDIALTGSGTIEGQGQAWWNALTATPTLARPQEVVFTNSTRVQISGIRLQNPPEEHIWVKGDTDVTVTGITIQTLAVAGQHIPNNTDGVDIGANGVFFCGNSIACGDDNVVMSGSNIYVAYSTFGVGHGCSIGSITESGVSAVTVDHVTLTGTTSGIRMKSARGRGGLVHDLTYSNITMTNVPNPVFITSYYPTLPTDPTTDPAQAVTTTTPQWENITIRNVTVVGSTVAGIVWGLPEAKISNLVFDNVSIRATQGMEIFHATGVSFINGSTVTVTTAPAVVTSDATVTGI
jgi:polygalacturonase